MVQNIEDRRLSGITPKLLWSGFIAWSTLLISIVGSYYNIKSEFQEQDKTNTVINLQIESIKRDLDLQKAEIDKLSHDLAIQSSAISILQVEKYK